MANDAGPIIRVSEVRKTFREGASRTDALRDVSFEIMPGEFCTIIGRSGSGKSTLLNLLAGLDHPTRGQIVILGRHIERMSEDELVAFRLRHVGFVFQSYNLFASYDALDNVAMPLTYRGVPRRVRERRARRMIQSVGLKHRMHHTPNKMSGGEQQRVGIARALITNPQIIFADEPTGNLDVKTSARALKLMVDCVRERGATLIVVTHDPEMSRYADRVIRLLDGRVIENTLNPHPDEIKPPEDSGQDWEPEVKPRAQPRPRRMGWLARRRAARRADKAGEAAPAPADERTVPPAAAASVPADERTTQSAEAVVVPSDGQATPSAEASAVPADERTAPSAEAVSAPADERMAPSAEAASVPEDERTAPTAEAASAPADERMAPSAEAASVPADERTVPPAAAALAPADERTAPSAAAASAPADERTAPSAEAASVPADERTAPSAEAASVPADERTAPSAEVSAASSAGQAVSGGKIHARVQREEAVKWHPGE